MVTLTVAATKVPAVAKDIHVVTGQPAGVGHPVVQQKAVSELSGQPVDNEKSDRKNGNLESCHFSI